MKTASPAPAVRKLVLVGGGHSHLAVLRHFAMHPLPGLSLTLVSQAAAAPYSGALAAYIAGHIGLDDMHVDLRPLAHMAGAELIHAAVEGLEPEAGRLLIPGRPALAYDLLSLNIGSIPAAAAIPGARRHAVAVKPMDDFLAHWHRLLEQLRGGLGAPLRLGFIGSGVAAVEIALNMQHRLAAELSARGQSPALLECHVFGAGDEPLPGQGRRLQGLARRLLQQRGIRFHGGYRVSAVDEGGVQGEGREPCALDRVFLLTQAAAPAWPGAAGLATDADGFVRVNRHLQSTSHSRVFAAGDIASVAGRPYPKSGVYAVRQGRPLARNLAAWLLGKKLRSYRPQGKALVLMGTGGAHALAARGRWAASGRHWWQLKRWLDRRFVERYSRVPPMPENNGVAPRLEGADPAQRVPPMRCGGCGAKVAGAVLRDILAELRPPRHPELINPLHNTEDAALVRVPPGQVLVQSIDALPALLNDDYRFGRIAAHHCLNDLFAMGARPRFALAQVTVPGGAEHIMAQRLRQLMAGLVDVLNAHDTALAGGHTSQAAELSAALVVNGFAAPEALLAKDTLRPGDILVLTKALGSGTLFAADMRRRARADWIEAAVAAMDHSNRDAAVCLREAGASACTDVSGFGLAGHLLEMLRPRRAHAELDLGAVPLLPGAGQCLAQGWFSSLHGANQRLAADALHTRGKLQGPLAVLFDPQTAGGLLAALPAGRAPACLRSLSEHGYDATKVGRVLSIDNDAPRLEVYEQ